MAGSFFDTNVLVYLASSDTGKADRAEAVVGEGGAISVQVLNELANVARRKMGLSWAETRALIEPLSELLSVQPLTLLTHETGLRLAELYSLSIYDALIVASALEAGCERLWSEDMQDDLLVDGQLRITNPFRPAV